MPEPELAALLEAELLPALLLLAAPVLLLVAPLVLPALVLPTLVLLLAALVLAALVLAEPPEPPVSSPQPASWLAATAVRTDANPKSRLNLMTPPCLTVPPARSACRRPRPPRPGLPIAGSRA
jgi:hypothetical protein